MPGSILILTNRVPYPLHDGGALAMDAMIRGYHRAGWQVHVLAMNTTRHPVAAPVLAQLYHEIAGFHTVETDNRIRPSGLLRNLLFSRDPEHASRFRSDAFAGKLLKLLRQVQPQVVQLESPFLATYIPLIREACRARLVYRAHNIEHQIWRRLAAEARGPRRAYLSNLARRMATFEHRLWQQADLTVAITNADAHIIAEHATAAKVLVAPFGLDTAAPPLPLPPPPLRIYHIGAMDWLPNQEGIRWFLEKVWPLVHDRAPQASFHFAGRAMPPSFEEGLPPQAFCAGEVKDARQFIADKHLLVVPLRSGSGIRVKTLEGMAAGRLVVSTDVGMQGIEAESGKHFLKANSVEEFVGQIIYALRHEEELRRIAAAGRNMVAAHYDAPVIMQRLSRALEC